MVTAHIIFGLNLIKELVLVVVLLNGLYVAALRVIRAQLGGEFVEDAVE